MSSTPSTPPMSLSDHSCIDCHHEHLGTGRMQPVTDSNCLTCHGNADDHAGLGAKRASASARPIFWSSPADNARLFPAAPASHGLYAGLPILRGRPSRLPNPTGESDRPEHPEVQPQDPFNRGHPDGRWQETRLRLLPQARQPRRLHAADQLCEKLPGLPRLADRSDAGRFPDSPSHRRRPGRIRCAIFS